MDPGGELLQKLLKQRQRMGETTATPRDERRTSDQHITPTGEDEVPIGKLVSVGQRRMTFESQDTECSTPSVSRIGWLTPLDRDSGRTFFSPSVTSVPSCSPRRAEEIGRLSEERRNFIRSLHNNMGARSSPQQEVGRLTEEQLEFMRKLFDVRTREDFICKLTEEQRNFIRRLAEKVSVQLGSAHSEKGRLTEEQRSFISGLPHGDHAQELPLDVGELSEEQRTLIRHLSESVKRYDHCAFKEAGKLSEEQKSVVRSLFVHDNEDGAHLAVGVSSAQRRSSPESPVGAIDTAGACKVESPQPHSTPQTVQSPLSRLANELRGSGGSQGVKDFKSACGCTSANEIGRTFESEVEAQSLRVVGANNDDDISVANASNVDPIASPAVSSQTAGAQACESSGFIESAPSKRGELVADSGTSLTMLRESLTSQSKESSFSAQSSAPAGNPASPGLLSSGTTPVEDSSCSIPRECAETTVSENAPSCGLGAVECLPAARDAETCHLDAPDVWASSPHASSNARVHNDINDAHVEKVERGLGDPRRPRPQAMVPREKDEGRCCMHFGRKQRNCMGFSSFCLDESDDEQPPQRPSRVCFMQSGSGIRAT